LLDARHILEERDAAVKKAQRTSRGEIGIEIKKGVKYGRGKRY
jgi:hypothetical protein